MKNIGRQNHARFKTKYWQQQHQPAKPVPLELTASLPFSLNRTRRQSPVRPSPPPGFNFSPLRAAKAELGSSQHVKRLKKQLESLNDESFNSLNGSAVLSRHPYVRTSQEGREYRGKSLLERCRRRPKSLSVTLEVRPGSQEYRIGQRF